HNHRHLRPPPTLLRTSGTPKGPACSLTLNTPACVPLPLPIARKARLGLLPLRLRSPHRVSKPRSVTTHPTSTLVNVRTPKRRPPPFHRLRTLPPINASLRTSWIGC